jgi:hypothetical protein
MNKINEMDGYRLVKFNINCQARYKGELLIPKEVPAEEELEYINKNLIYLNTGELEWIEDYPVMEEELIESSPVGEEDIEAYLDCNPSMVEYMPEYKELKERLA